MPILEHVSGDSAELTLSGKLTFADSSEFRKKLASVCGRPIKSLHIKLGDLSFMDSSGLGMLMVAHNECKAHNISLSLLHPKGDVKSLLQMTKSYERFKIID